MKFVACVLLLLLATPGHTEVREELDLRVIGFCAIASFTNATQNPRVCAEIKEICGLGEVVESIDRDLGRSFVFVNKVRQIQLGHPNTFEGQDRKANGPETIVFVTEPIPILKNGILVFVSASAPARVAIFFLGQDLKGELIYDSFEKPKYLNGRGLHQQDPIGAIRRIRVRQDGAIFVTEYPDGVLSRSSRRFRVEYESGRLGLRLIGR